MRPETELFGALLVDPSQMDMVTPIVRVEDFILDEDRALYRAMLTLSEYGQPITAVHLAAKLTELGWPTQRAQNVVMRELSSLSGIPELARSYAVLVHETARKRRLIGAMEALMSQAQEPGANPGQLIEVFQERIFELQSDKPEMEVAPVREAAVSFLEMAHRERQHVGSLSGLSTGVDDLDLSTTGIREGELWVVGAMAGRGKTSLGMQIASRNASDGIGVGIFSMEMTREELVRRLIGEKVGAWHARNLQSVSEGDWVTIKEYAAELASWPLFIDDSSGLYAADIAARARLAIRQRNLKLIVVDYLQLIRGKEREVRERVGNAANTLRALAKDTGVRVVLLSQLRRPGDINAKPTMLELKESGEIENHAHTVLLIYMPLGEDGRPTGEDEIVIGKQRNGPLGTVTVHFDKRSLSFKARTRVER